ncbi:alpha-2-macroglobulin [soil metagenome]
MKIHSLPVLLCLLLASRVPAVELIVEPETLTPASTLELRFDNPMVDKKDVGTVAKESPLIAKPPVTGEFKWTSTRSGQFRFTQPPGFATTYEFTLREGIKDAGGVALPNEEAWDLSSEGLLVADESHEYAYSSGNSAQRKPSYLLQFNDAINPAELTTNAYFSNPSIKDRLPVTVRPATGKDFKSRYQSDVIPTWDELTKGVKPKLSPEDVRPNAFVIESKEPLPVGDNWQLTVAAALPNASGSGKLGADYTQAWGSIMTLASKQIAASTHFDSPHSIDVQFNKVLTSSELKTAEISARISPFVIVEPAVKNFAVEASYTSLSITGDFLLGTAYTVTLKAGLPGGDGLGLPREIKETVTFNPSQAFVSTSAFTNSQLATGNGVYDIYAANFKDLRIRVKQLSDGELVKARVLCQDTYNAFDPKTTATTQYLKDTPFETFPGKVVFEKHFANDKPLEKASHFNLNWKEVLGKTPAAPVFIEIEGIPQDGAPAGTIFNRAIVEFTDIGLLLKNNYQQSLVYAFSLRTGEPLPGVQLTFMDDERGYLQATTTDAQGFATVATKDAAWVLAKKGDDCTAMNFSERDNRIGLWGHGLNLSWKSPWTPRYESFLFSDRPVYKPGDTAHVKAIARLRSGDTLSLGDKPLTATVTVSDERDRKILDKQVTLTANGTWTGDITFPEEQVGWFTLRLKFNHDDALAVNGDEVEEDSEENGYLSLRVDDYKPNTFEVSLDGSKYQATKDHVTVPLKANYYMGKSLSQAKVTWSAGLAEDYTPPDEFAEYHFGDAPRWWHYGENRDDETADEEDHGNDWGAHGELTLKDDGTVDIDLPPPPPHKASLPQTITVYADVTDVNQQTISATTEFKLPGADFIVGVKKNRWYAQTGQEMGFDFVAITPKGDAFKAPVGADVKIERLQWNTVRVEGAGGAITTKNQSVLIPELKATVALSSVNGQVSGAHFGFTPKQGGTYFLTSTAMDAQGKTVLTRVPFYVISNDGFPWAWEDGAKITLQPDKTVVKPGEEISIVVKSPISGKALVTVERNRVHRQFLADISPENPVIKLKLTEEEAPNAFVSVIVIRGAKDSPQPDPMPEYKVGYCEITVNSDKDRLFVTAESSQATVKPGEDLTVSATVLDAGKQPVEGAEVTLYAVDEGVLSLMAYETPEPFEFFHASAPLAITSYTTIDSLLPEALSKRYRGNKGIIVGGGGEEGGADAALRKNFVATAIWSAALITDKSGKVTNTFKVPDSLTRYRIMAVACKDAQRFGTAESAFVVNKPLMVEPVVPRFAHVGDELLLKAVIHNTTEHAGTVEVELKLDDKASIITEERPFALIGLKNRTSTNDGKSERRVISLKAGETTSIPFPVRFLQQGGTAMQWSVKTMQWPQGAPALIDRVESKFEVTHPSPALREVHYFDLTHAPANDNLLKQINPQLLEADGKLHLDFSQSRLSEARDALDHILHYPYGCVEQTTSSTLPWLALSRYDTLFPDLIDKTKATTAIKRGVARLLQMQTPEGGLAYWPGGDKPIYWGSAYGGYALLKAKDWGVFVPQESIDSLLDYLSKGLRTFDLSNNNKSTDLTDAALGLYTLAKAGKGEASYEALLYQRRDKLPETARLYLALSMCISKAPEKQIVDLIKAPAKRDEWNRYWMAPQLASALRLLVTTHLGMTKEAQATADEMLRSRNPNGGWGTTYGNAWSLLALTAAEKPSKEAMQGPLAITAKWQNQSREVTLPSALASVSLDLPFGKNAPASTLSIAKPDNQTLLTRVEVKAWPDIKTFQPVTKGFTIARRYERLTPMGTREAAKNLRVGDMIIVTLDITVHKSNRYLVVDDPLPSVFEPINPEFSTQNERADAQAQVNSWFCDHRELRNDRAVFFTDEPTGLGKFELSYLARVIAEGDVLVPPARIEAMYQPDHYGLSEIQHVQTLPMGDDGDVAKK